MAISLLEERHNETTSSNDKTADGSMQEALADFTGAESTDQDKKPLEIVENRERDFVEEYPTGFGLAIILIAVFMNTFLAALDLGIVATAIPEITDDFQKLDHVGWYGSAYFLTIGVFSPFWGKLYKYCPTQIVFLCTVGLFEVGSIVAATSPTSEAFIVGRALQGWGAAGILGGGFLIMHHVAQPNRRPAFTGLLLSVFLCSTILGPILGGAFTSRVSWRWCFYINLPIGGLAMGLILIFFRTPAHVQPVPATLTEILLQLDFIGILLMTASLVCYILALQWGGLTLPWNSGAVIATLVLWVVLTIAFFLYEFSIGDYAMISLRLLKRRETWANSLFGYILNDPDWIFLYYLPVYFQSVHGLSAIDSGVANLTFLGLFSVGSLVGGWIVGKFRLVQPVAALGGLFCTAGAALIYTLNTKSSRSAYLGYQVLLGFGIGIGNQLPMTAVQGFSAPEDLTSNTGIVMMAQLISGCYFVTAGQSIFSNLMLNSLPSFAPGVNRLLLLHTGATEIRSVFNGSDLTGVINAYMAGIKGAFILGLAGAVASVLVTLLIPTKRLPLPQTKTQDAEH